MTYLLRIMAVEGELLDPLTEGPYTAPLGRYVAFFDPEMHDGQGAMTATDDPEKALQFATFQDIIETYQQRQDDPGSVSGARRRVHARERCRLAGGGLRRRG